MARHPGIRPPSGPVVAVLLLALGIAACGEPPAAEPSKAAPPIAGTALDRMQANVRQVLDRDFAGLRAEQSALTLDDDGRRAIVRTQLPDASADADLDRLCRAILAAAAPDLLEGQSLEVNLLRSGEVAHSCGS